MYKHYQATYVDVATKLICAEGSNERPLQVVQPRWALNWDLARTT